MSYVDSFLVINDLPPTVRNDVIVWGKKEDSVDSPRKIKNAPELFMCTSIILWLVIEDGGAPYEDYKINFPDLIMEFPVKPPPSPSPKNTSLTVENKNKKIVLRLKNFKIPGRTGSPTSVNVHVGGN